MSLEQLEILLALRKKSGEEVIKLAIPARLAVHQRLLRELSKQNPLSRPGEVFSHSAYGVTTADSDILEYNVIGDLDKLQLS